MKLFSATSVLIACATPLFAQTDYNAILAEGPKPAVQALEAIESKSPSDLFALGAAQVLSAVETAYQTRYTYGIFDNDTPDLSDIPFFRIPVTPNPNPQEFTPQVVDHIFLTALADLANARTSLDQIEASDEAAVSLDLAKLWMDINQNGLQDPGESFAHLFAPVLEIPLTNFESDSVDLTVQFDTADAAWLSAYTHVLSGTSEVILAMDPSQALTEVISGASQMDTMRGETGISIAFFSGDDLPEIDLAMAYFASIEGPMDVSRTRNAHQHFLDALSDNRSFWARLDAETDNQQEFIPNAQQTSALAVDFPDGIDVAWQDVLADAEAILNGDLLLPHWRLGDQAGINLYKLFMEPPDIDFIGMIHGYALAPYAEIGEVATLQTLEKFDEVTGGNSGFFALTLN